MEKYLIKVDRRDGIEKNFPILSLLFSDEILSFDYVYKCLLEWQLNPNIDFVVLSNIECDISSVFKDLYDILANEPQFIQKTDLLIATTERVIKNDRMVCSKCKNYGSIISGREPNISAHKLICENCETSTLDRISDTVWSRRCGEIAYTTHKNKENNIQSMRKVLFKVMMENQRGLTNNLQSMMIIDNVDEVNLSKLLCLFTIKEFRSNKNCKHMIEEIPVINSNKNSMLSICTAGLDSIALFGKN